MVRDVDSMLSEGMEIQELAFSNPRRRSTIRPSISAFDSSPVLVDDCRVKELATSRNGAEIGPSRTPASRADGARTDARRLDRMAKRNIVAELIEKSDFPCHRTASVVAAAEISGSCRAGDVVHVIRHIPFSFFFYFAPISFCICTFHSANATRPHADGRGSMAFGVFWCIFWCRFNHREPKVVVHWHLAY